MRCLDAYRVSKQPASPAASSMTLCVGRRMQSVPLSQQSHQHSSVGLHSELSCSFRAHRHAPGLHVPYALAEQSRAQVQQQGSPQQAELMDHQEEQAADVQPEPPASADSHLSAKIDRLSSHAAASTSGQQHNDSTPSPDSSSSAADSQSHDSQHEAQWEFVGVYRPKGPSGRAKPPNQQPRLSSSMWQERPSGGAGDQGEDLTAHLKPRRPKYQPREDPIKWGLG